MNVFDLDNINAQLRFRTDWRFLPKTALVADLEFAKYDFKEIDGESRDQSPIRGLAGHVGDAQAAGLAAMAKNVATDMCSYVVDQAVQLHGGYGYMREYTVERLFRDARLYPIGGGTREIMNEIIAKTEGY